MDLNQKKNEVNDYKKLYISKLNLLQQYINYFEHQLSLYD